MKLRASLFEFSLERFEVPAVVMTNHISYRNSNEPMSIDSTELKDIEASATSLRKPVAEILETSSKPTQSSGEQNGRASRCLA